MSFSAVSFSSRRGSLAQAARINEGAASGPSAWARRLLEKQGWQEGSGLGAASQGITSHLRITKKSDVLAGVGAARSGTDAAAFATDSWWAGAYAAGAAARIGGNVVEAYSDSDSSRDCISRDGSTTAMPSVGGTSAIAMSSGVDFDALFRATGGARLGMRAHRAQPGKLRRAEDTPTSAVDAIASGQTELQLPSAKRPRTRSLASENADVPGEAARQTKVNAADAAKLARRERRQAKSNAREQSVALEVAVVAKAEKKAAKRAMREAWTVTECSI